MDKDNFYKIKTRFLNITNIEFKKNKTAINRFYFIKTPPPKKAKIVTTVKKPNTILTTIEKLPHD